MSKIYYTGDMANCSGWFNVVKQTAQNVWLKEIDGDREFSIYPVQIGNVYKGHCNPRFVTELAYNAYHAA